MSSMLDRRNFLRLLGYGAATASLWPARQATAGPALGDAAAFSTDLLRQRARELSESAFQTRTATLPQALESLNYDQFRDIRYIREQDLWYGEHDFNIEFFHMGYFYKEPVRVFSVENDQAAEVLYSPGLFDFGKNDISDDLQGVPGFAGMRILYPLNTREYKDELGAVLGASYFRLLGKHMLYGLSARGLAINTVGEGAEEFPIFREFYLEVPSDPERLVMHALLDSPSVTGAYRFDIKPGDDTVMDIDFTLFPRTRMSSVGIAPLTSMFLFAPNDRVGVDDFREAVHDSDGLLLHTGANEWIWRPVVNPSVDQVNSFVDPSVRGFGLMQRERRFSDYQDLESRYERRPSAWVETVGDWGPGHVVLLELYTENETNDNLVAFWQPETPLAAGSEVSMSYRLHWCLEVPAEGTQPLRAVATRTGSGASIGVDADKDVEFGTRLFMIDFEGDDLPDPTAEVEAVVSATGGTISSVTTEYNEPRHAWRTYFRVRPDSGDDAATVDDSMPAKGGAAEAEAPDDGAVDGKPANEEPGKPTGKDTSAAPSGTVEIRCFLKLDVTTLSETWLYHWKV